MTKIDIRQIGKESVKLVRIFKKQNFKTQIEKYIYLWETDLYKGEEIEWRDGRYWSI